MGMTISRWQGSSSVADTSGAPLRCRGNLGPDRAVCAVWWYDCRHDDTGALRPSEEHTIFAQARFVPETIIDGNGEERRTHGHLIMSPGMQTGNVGDRVLRSIWPVAGRDMMKIKERMYQIVACHRIVDGGRFGHAYRVDIR